MLESLFIGINFIKKRIEHRCFPVNIAKFLRIGFFIWYLLCYCSSISISLSLSRKILSVAICLIGLGQLQIFLIYTN